METPDAIRTAVAAKGLQDEQKFAIAAARLDAKEEKGLGREPGEAPDVMLAATPPAESPAPMSVATAPISLEAKAVANAAPAPAPAPQVLPVEESEAIAIAATEEATPAAQSTSSTATLDERMAATAYVPEPEQAGVGGFFARVISKVNPF
jgi:hypothetical protein